VLDYHQRKVLTRCWTEAVLWLAFNKLCAARRGAADYIELASQHLVVLISAVPVSAASMIMKPDFS
jgi:predicted ATPase